MSYLKKLSLIVVVALVAHSSALADAYQYLFNDAFSGTAPEAANPPWLNATFRDIAPGTVELTVTNLALTGSENVDQLYFNLAPNLNPFSLIFSFVSSSGGFDVPTVSLGTNAFKADGDGKYDVLFDFAQGGTPENRFTQGESVTYTISGIAGLSATDFGYLSFPAGGAGPFYAATHVQRIGADSLSGWVSADLMSPIQPVPEPGAGSFLGLAVTLWFGYRLWTRAAKAVRQKPQLRAIPIRSGPISRRRNSHESNI